MHEIVTLKENNRKTIASWWTWNRDSRTSNL